MLCIHPNAATSLHHACYAILGMLLFQERRCALQKKRPAVQHTHFQETVQEKETKHLIHIVML